MEEVRLATMNEAVTSMFQTLLQKPEREYPGVKEVDWLANILEEELRETENMNNIEFKRFVQSVEDGLQGENRQKNLLRNSKVLKIELY